MYNRLDSIPACDRQTDGRTDRQISRHGIVRAMHTRGAVKTTSRSSTINVITAEFLKNFRKYIS